MEPACFESAADAAARIPNGSLTASPVHVLAALVRSHVEVIMDDVGAAAVFVHEWRSLGGERRAAVLERRDAYERRFRDLIEAGIARGDFEPTDPAIAATAILSALNGIPTWYRPDGRLPADRIADHFVDLVVRMLHGASR